MAELRPAGPFPFPSVAMETWLVRFDDKGACISPATRQAALAVLERNRERDVIFFSHGWQTDFDSAVEQYTRFLQAFEIVMTRDPAPQLAPLFVGITWPSKWFASKGPTMAAAPSGADPTLEVVEDLARTLDGKDSARLYELAGAVSISEDELKELIGLLLRAKPEVAADEISDSAQLDLETALASVKAMQKLSGGGGGLGPIGTVAPVGGGLATAAGGSFDPLNPIRLFSLLQMKDRAGRVGANGVGALMTDLTQRARSVHCVGHSFGAKVMLSALIAGARPQKPKSMLLLQPAISHLAFAELVPTKNRPGGYQAATTLVKQPIFSTFSRLDQPLHDIFHLAVRRAADLGELQVADDEPPSPYAALGGYGPRGAASQTLLELPASGAPFADYSSARVVGLDGGPTRRITSHGDVGNAHTAWALRHLMTS